ncbi:MAG: dolichyl-phosphate-mannose-protein mannosyltransferase [Cyanothece sp. SIO2G6]|nr:dolichyl-phosphate-mannose-protein mannosyltransferase [Cyanothece sp. SIO2G6]
MTSLRMSGYTQPQFEATVYNSEIHTVAELREGYQYPDNGSTAADMWAALRQHPEHSPAYYVLVRRWMQVLPNTVLSVRLLSVLISLLALPCMYWLTWELFGSSLISWAATALLAISPFHVLYAQEAREYALWTVTILLSSATLLWALRQRQGTMAGAMTWITYGLTNALGLYVHPFSGFVTASHGLYILITQQWRVNRQTLSYAIATGFSILLFLPWLWVVIEHADRFVGNTASVTQPRSGLLPLFWLLNLSRLFLDLNQGPSAINPAHYLLLLLALVACVHLCRHSPASCWSFVFLLMGVTGLALLGPDVLLGGRRSSITRYAVPAYLGLQISVSYLLATQITANPFAVRSRFRIRRRWRGVAIALALAGVISCGVNAHHSVWWHKSYAKSRRNPDVAQVINASERPLVITDRKPAGRMLSLLHLLDQDVSVQLVERPGPVRTPKRFSDIFLYLPSDWMRQRVEQKVGAKLQPLTFNNEDDPWLWRVSR